MKSGLVKRMIVMTLFPALMVPTQLIAQHYTVIILNGTSGAGNGINNRSWVTGTANLNGGQTLQAALWIKGSNPINLGTLGGDNSGVLFPVKSDMGKIAGVAETADTDPLGEYWSCSFFFPTVTGHTCLGFVWRKGVKTPLPTLGRDNGFAAGINNRGQVVGWAENTFRDPTCAGPNGRNQVLQFEAVIWGSEEGQIQQLPPFPGDPDSAAVAINDEGQVVGISGLCDQAVGRFSARHAVLWDNATVTNLGDFGGIAWNTPVAINNRGQVAGFSDFPGDDDGAPNFHAFFWTKETGVPQDLGTLSGDFVSLGLGMNNRGQVVGESIGAKGPRAFLWKNDKMMDLNQLAVPPGSSLTLQFAGDINDRGEITGGAVDANNERCAAGCVFLAIPRQE
jgi:probable HAF family extracellular repeat protein